MAVLERINADRAARRPEAITRRLAAEGRSLVELTASVSTWSMTHIRDFLVDEKRRR